MEVFMEFLDDLIENQDRNKITEQNTDPETDAWNDLVNGVAFEDSLHKSTDEKKRGRFRRNRKPSSKRPSRKKTTSRRRKIILAFLGISVFIVWGLIFAVILRTSDMPIIPGAKAPSKPNPTEDAPAQQTLETENPPSPGSEESTTESAPAGESSSDEETGETAEIPPPPSVPGAPFTRFDREIQDNPGFIDLYQLRGQEYIDKGAYEAALADFQYVLARDDSRAEAHAGIGMVYFHLRRWNDAELYFKSALDRNDELSPAYYWLGHIYYYKGEYKAAYHAYDMAAEYDRSNAAAEAWLGITSAKLGDYYETLGAVTRAMSITQDIAVNFVASSWEHLLQDPSDIDGAQGDLLYARELEPNSFITLHALANFYLNYRPERLAEAELLAHYAQNWAQNDIEQAMALHTLGRIYLVKGLNADAEKVFIQAMDLSTVDGFVILAGLPDDFNRSRQ
jgi:tetratricopeptide (TPR) repeat protein